MATMYYGPLPKLPPSGIMMDDTYRLSPIPHISISRDISYANDIIAGYTYNININGYVTNSGLLPPTGNILSHNLSNILSNIERVKGILSYNGSTLAVLDDNDKLLICASGGILRSLSFDESDNQWTNYAPYSATIEFNEVTILNESLSSAISGVSISTNIIDINKYKIKTFNENWSFELSNDYYNHILYSDISGILKINNSIINVSYNLSATGKNYYDFEYAGSEFLKSKTKAAWLQAKDFVQDRLYTQVKALVGGILHIDDTKVGKLCESDKTLGPENISTISGQDSSQINYIDSPNGDNGILKDIKDKYKAYNETITCNTSESDGTFSITYNTILKRNKDDSAVFDADNILHTISKTINNTINNPNDYNTTISVEGKIQGLIEGGLSNSSGNYTLPQNGRLLIVNNTLSSKFNNAEAFLPSILDLENDDLKSDFKNALGITYSDLGIQGNWARSEPFLTNSTTCTIDPLSPLPTSFILTKNYIDANITYSAEYTSNKNGIGTKDKFITFSSYTVEEPVSVLAEHVFPGSFYATPSRSGTIVYQDIDTVTPRKISIVIEGRDKTLRKCSPCGVLVTDVINGLTIPDLPDTILPDPEIYILTGRQTSWNAREGSYIVNLSYICQAGCKI
jgi:hypothetical protein